MCAAAGDSPPKFIATKPLNILLHPQPKVKDKVGNENNLIHVENAAAAAAAAAASSAAGETNLSLPIESLRAVNLLEVRDAFSPSVTFVFASRAAAGS